MQLSRLGSNTLQNIPEEVREHVKLLLNVAPAVRPDADQMTKVSKQKQLRILSLLKNCFDSQNKCLMLF